MWSCVREGSGWGLGKRSSLEGCLGTGTGSAGQWSQHKASGVQGTFQQCSQTCGLILGSSCSPVWSLELD